MKIKKAFSILLSAAVLFVCLPYNSFAETVSVKGEYVEGEVIITSSKEIEDIGNTFLTAESSDTVSLDFDKIGIEEIEMISDEEIPSDNVYVAEIDGDVEKTCEKLNRNKNITAEPNYIFSTEAFEMPAEISAGVTDYNQYQKRYFDDILHIPAAWQAHENTGEGVTIAVIDNGFDISTPDFPVNLWQDSQENVGYNAFDTESSDIGAVTDDNGNYLEDSAHGSNVAGIIGMPANGRYGVGAAYGAELMLIKAGCFILGKSRTSITAAAVYNGIIYATDNGADIITMSITSPDNSSTISQAVDYAYSHGVAMFAAAGNYGSSQDIYPAAYEHVMGVMAVDTLNPYQLADFSDYDAEKGYYQIAAPGVSILGCGIGEHASSVMSGTSQAAPLTAGCAAMYLSIHPHTAVDSLYAAIVNSSRTRVASNPDTCETTVYYYRSLDAQKLLDYVPSADIPTPEIIFNPETTATPNGSFLFGLNENFTDIFSYVTVRNGTGVFTPTELGNGTGSVLDIYNNNGELYKSYTILIIGDINGDCRADAMDAVLIKCYLTRMISLSTAQFRAADVNFDNSITVDDVYFDDFYFPSDFTIITRYAVGSEAISQI